MNANEFLAKFPDAKANENCLIDMACSQCGNRRAFRVYATTQIRLKDDGTDQEETGYKYDFRSGCECVECRAEGTISTFSIDGLDDLIESNSDHED